MLPVLSVHLFMFLYMCPLRFLINLGTEICVVVGPLLNYLLYSAHSRFFSESEEKKPDQTQPLTFAFWLVSVLLAAEILNRWDDLNEFGAVSLLGDVNGFAPNLRNIWEAYNLNGNIRLEDAPRFV